MHLLRLLLLSTLISSPMIAIAADALSNTSSANVTAPMPVGQEIPQTSIATPGKSSFTPGTQQIGFDPKVKRDPQGKPIVDASPVTAPTTQIQGLPNDRGMRSDRDLRTKSDRE